MPILEYAFIIWDPHTQKDVLNLEKIQKRASRFVMNRYLWSISVTNLIGNLGWESLQSRRSHLNVTMIYKITNSLVSIPCSQSLIPCASTINFAISSLTQESMPIYIPFLSSAIRLWNSNKAFEMDLKDHFKLYNCIHCLYNLHSHTHTHF